MKHITDCPSITVVHTLQKQITWHVSITVIHTLCNTLQGARVSITVLHTLWNTSHGLYPSQLYTSCKTNFRLCIYHSFTHPVYLLKLYTPCKKTDYRLCIYHSYTHPVKHITGCLFITVIHTLWKILQAVYSSQLYTPCETYYKLRIHHSYTHPVQHITGCMCIYHSYTL